MDRDLVRQAVRYTAPAENAFIALAPLQLEPTGLDYLVRADELDIAISYDAPDPSKRKPGETASFREAIGTWRWTAPEGVTVGNFRTAIEAAVDAVRYSEGVLPMVKVTEHRFVNDRSFAVALKRAGEHVYEFRSVQVWCRTSEESVYEDPGLKFAVEPCR